MPICPVTKENKFTVAITKNTHLGQGRQNFNTRFEFGLHMPVKFYPDPLRFAGVIHEKPILSKYMLC